MVNTSTARHLIWVVDDERDVRDALKDYLEVEGFDVRTFDDGAAAWSAVEAGDALPNAIVLDQEMPRMDGREFRRRQGERKEVANIPVLVFTASQTLLLRSIDPRLDILHSGGLVVSCLLILRSLFRAA